MCRPLIDAPILNYVAKARVAATFLNSLAQSAAVLPEIVRQLEPVLSKWPELSAITDAADSGRIEVVEPTMEEQLLRARLLEERPWMGAEDNAMLAVAKLRGWTLLTTDSRLIRRAEALDIQHSTLADALTEAVTGGFLSEKDREWVVYYSQGGAERRPVP